MLIVVVVVVIVVATSISFAVYPCSAHGDSWMKSRRGCAGGEGLKSAFLRFELPQLVAKERSTRREDNPLHSVFLFLKSSLHLFRFCYLFFATHTGIGTGTGTHLHSLIVFLFLVVVVSLQLPRLQFTQICLISFWVSLIVSSF